jgi:CBS domain-containing protein
MLRLQNQSRAIKYGREPTNYLAPADLSDFERHHLRDAFVVVRRMQAAIGHGTAALR